MKIKIIAGALFFFLFLLAFNLSSEKERKESIKQIKKDEASHEKFKKKDVLDTKKEPEATNQLNSKFINQIFVKENKDDSLNNISKEVEKKSSKEKEEVVNEEVVKENYLEGIPIELLEEYEESIKGTTRTFPAFVFVVHLGSVRGPQKMVAFELLEEYGLALKTIEGEKNKLSSEEFSLKKKKMNKIYEESFLSLLETKEQKEDFIRFVKDQLKGSKYY